MVTGSSALPQYASPGGPEALEGVGCSWLSNKEKTPGYTYIAFTKLIIMRVYDLYVYCDIYVYSYVQIRSTDTCHIHIRIYVYMYMYICIYACMYICVCVYLYINFINTLVQWQ